MYSNSILYENLEIQDLLIQDAFNSAFLSSKAYCDTIFSFLMLPFHLKDTLKAYFLAT